MSWLRGGDWRLLGCRAVWEETALKTMHWRLNGALSVEAVRWSTGVWDRVLSFHVNIVWISVSCNIVWPCFMSKFICCIYIEFTCCWIWRLTIFCKESLLKLCISIGWLSWILQSYKLRPQKLSAFSLHFISWNLKGLKYERTFPIH